MPAIIIYDLNVNSIAYILVFFACLKEKDIDASRYVFLRCKLTCLSIIQNCIFVYNSKNSIFSMCLCIRFACFFGWK